jgi:hypothetical protein
VPDFVDKLLIRASIGEYYGSEGSGSLLAAAQCRSSSLKILEAQD